jgi:hypothetical protein
VSLESALKNIDAAIRGWELDKESCRETGNRQGLDTANRALKDLYAAREDALPKTQRAAKEQADLQETLSLHEEVIENFWKWPIGRQQRYVSLIVESVTMEEVSPHVLKLAMTFKSPIDCTLTGYVLRSNSGQRKWTDEELCMLQTFYPTADRADILQAIPNRSWQCIRQQALEMGISRFTWENTSGIPNHLTYTDIQLIESLQAEYPLFGTCIGKWNAPIIGVWQLFDSAVLRFSNKQDLIHHQPVEY